MPHHTDGTAAHDANNDGVHTADGADTTAYAKLVSHDGADLLQYLGEHSTELLAATKTAGAHALHGGAGNDTLIASHGTAQLTGGAGADTFAFLLDSDDAASWQQPGKISDYNPAEGDRIVLAGRGLADARLEVSTDGDGQHLNITDHAGHTRSIDIAAAGGKPLTVADILSHVEIRDPQQYDPSHHNTPHSAPLPQEDNSHLI